MTTSCIRYCAKLNPDWSQHRYEHLADENGFSTVVAKLWWTTHVYLVRYSQIELRHRGLTQGSSAELIGRLLYTVCRTIREFEAV